MLPLSLPRWAIVTEPRFGYVTGKWIVPMSDGSVRRFARRTDAESLIARRPVPSLKTLLSASVKETT